MGDHSAIEWTDATWNPVTGCTRVSAGCDNCYAARFAATRGKHMRQYQGLATITRRGGAAFNGKIRLLPERLEEPLRWTRPRRVFVNSMSDLFHDGIPDDYIDQVFAAMALAPQHVFQVLTKRPVRMHDYITRPGIAGAVAAETGGGVDGTRDWPFIRPDDLADRWPLPNVWLGVSTENQDTADDRIPPLLATPAAVRFISAEPLLGGITLRQTWRDYLSGWDSQPVHVCGGDPERCRARCPEAEQYQMAALNWVIVGGESGPGARHLDVRWVRSLLEECRATSVPIFVKQLGGNVIDRNDAGFEGDGWPGCWPMDTDVEDLTFQGWQGDPVRIRLVDPKGGDPTEWPEDLRVREMPRQAVPA